MLDALPAHVSSHGTSPDADARRRSASDARGVA